MLRDRSKVVGTDGSVAATKSRREGSPLDSSKQAFAFAEPKRRRDKGIAKHFVRAAAEGAKHGHHHY
jgi:hypothetical protein